MGFKRRVVRIEALLHISPFVLGILRVGEVGSFVVIQWLKSSGYRERQFRALGRCCRRLVVACGLCSRVGLLDLVTAESGSDSRKKTVHTYQ